MRSKVLIILLSCFVLFSCNRKSGPNTKLSNPNYGVQSKNDNNVLDLNDFDNESDINYYVTVVKVVDGDTFDAITQDRIEIRYRLHGIDAPERKQDFSAKSRDKLSELIFGKSVGIKVHKKRDGYGRPVVYVSTTECYDVGAEMLKSGLAWHSKKYDNSELYDELEKEARKMKIGLWSVNDPVPPWEYRK